ncbi:MAG: FtsQ-type POTRA domain-containing protein [Thermaerobacter sp.]|nr:FtsQ-type POTRA domain-containing protein [Thermaerobacter sp.]
MFAKFARLLLGLLLVLGLVAFLDSSYFQLRSVRVTGGDALLNQQVRALAGVPSGQNIWRVDPVQVADRVRRDPWVGTARVYRSLPSTLVIQIQPRRAVGMIWQQGRYFILSAGGWVLQRSSSLPNALPFLTPAPPATLRVGRQVAAPWRQLCAAAADVPSGLAISELHRRSDGTLFAYLLSGVAVRLGQGQVRQKLAELPPLLAQQARLGQHPVRVDLGDPNRPVVQEGKP